MPEVKFSVNGGGVESFIDKIKQKSSQMTSEAISNAMKQTDVAKEQMKIVEAQIHALERKNKLELEASIAQIKANESSRREGIGQRISQLYSQQRKDIEDYKSGGITRDEFSRRKSSSNKEISSLEREGEGLSHSSEEQINQLKEQSRQSTLLGRYMRENIDTIKTTSRQELNQMRRGDESLVDAIDENEDPQRRLANQLASQQYIQEQAKKGGKGEKEDSDPFTWKSGMLKLANAIAFEKVGGMVASIPQAKNELEYVKPMLATIGMSIGGLLGNAADAIAGIKVLGFGLGQTSFGQLGAQLGEKLGEFAGGAAERTFKGREELSNRNLALEAVTGRDFGAQKFRVGQLGMTGEMSKLGQDLTRFGLDFKEVSQLQYDIATRKGNGGNLERDAINIAAMQQGWGLKQETSMGMLELLRSNKEGDKNLVNVIGGVLQKGQGGIFKDGDRSFLNEFLARNYTQLQRTMLQTQNNVASGTVMDVISRFNSLGGPFSAQDSRSTGLINQIQGSLANPGSDNLKALAFTNMRRLNPNMGIAGLLEEQQKGLGSPMYLKSMLGSIDSMGGDRDMKIMNVAGMFGLQGNIAAARKIYENRKALMSGAISMDQLKGTGEFGEASVRSQGEDRTGYYTKSTAEIENAFIKSSVDGVKLVGEKMKVLMGDMLDGLRNYLQDELKKLVSSSGSSDAKKYENAVYTGAPGQVRSASGFNVMDPEGRKQALSNGDFGPKF